MRQTIWLTRSKSIYESTARAPCFALLSETSVFVPVGCYRACEKVGCSQPQPTAHESQYLGLNRRDASAHRAPPVGRIALLSGRAAVGIPREHGSLAHVVQIEVQKHLHAMVDCSPLIMLLGPPAFFYTAFPHFPFPSLLPPSSHLPVSVSVCVLWLLLTRRSSPIPAPPCGGIPWRIEST